MEIKNTRALVTGASRGLGKSIAAALARRGVDVALVARKSDKLDSAADLYDNTDDASAQMLRQQML